MQTFTGMATDARTRLEGPVGDPGLCASLRQRIAADGPLSFADFMEASLYDSEAGYYAVGINRTGRGGDFLTNVSVSSLFGVLLARHIAQVWHGLGRPAKFRLVEQGANTGDLLHDILNALKETECFDALMPAIIEPFPSLEEAQRERLAGFAVEWHRSLDTLVPMQGIHFSNELPDAFPVHLIRRRGEAWCELRVDWKSGQFAFVESDALSDSVREEADKIPLPLPEGYTTEVRPALAKWISDVSRILPSGRLLCIDYGFPREQYFDPLRTEGTLSAYWQHRRIADPLCAPGTIDLTAHVDFTRLVELALDTGFRLSGFADQHHFLVDVARADFARIESATPSPALAKELSALKTLLHPSTMGMAFKFLALDKGAKIEPPPAGFSFASDPKKVLDLG